MEKYIKKYEQIFEQDNNDPYNEEINDENLTPGSLEYKGDIIPFLKNLENAQIDGLLEKLLDSEDLDERMDLAEEILMVIENEFQEIYDEVEDDVKDLAID
jgi:hypothetical protein